MELPKIKISLSYKFLEDKSAVISCRVGNLEPEYFYFCPPPHHRKKRINKKWQSRYVKEVRNITKGLMDAFEQISGGAVHFAKSNKK